MTPAGTPARTRALPAAVIRAAAMLLLVTTAQAADTQWWIADSPDDYAKAESHGVIVHQDGSLELGPRVLTAPDDSMTTVWALGVLKDGSVALGGDKGRIDRWTERGGVKPWVKLPVGQVLSLGTDGDGLVAGTGPEGLIYRIGASGDTSLFARTGERYVWGLAPAGSGAWYAATGTRGRLLRVTRGKSTIAFDSDESNLVSIVSDGAGGVFAGGDSHGKVVHLTAQGRTTTVFDAGEDEIRALALVDGALYAAGLSAPAVSGGGNEEDETPSPARAAASGARAVVYRIVPDSVATTRWTSPQPYVYALLATPQGVLAATGNRGGVYRLEGGEGASQWLAAPQGQITALVARGGEVYAASANPAALLRLGPGKAERGELLSPALDARRIARFGRVRWRGAGHAELEARSGNTDPPDTTWSPWKKGANGADGMRIEAPPARYLQWKLTLTGTDTRISTVEASWREQNLPPRVEELKVSVQGQDVREGELSPRNEPITQALPGGQRVEYSLPPKSSARSLREVPVYAQGLRTATWRGVDPNGDALRYQLDLEADPGSQWIPLEDDVRDNAYTFDTHALPDGRYRLRVRASDKDGNAAGEDRTGEAVSAPFTVDNTPPSVTSLEANAGKGGIRVEAKAEDAESTLSRLEVAVDGEDWRPVTPNGGFADAREVTIDTTVPGVQPGTHTIGVRAVDSAGNATTRARIVTVPGK